MGRCVRSLERMERGLQCLYASEHAVVPTTFARVDPCSRPASITPPSQSFPSPGWSGSLARGNPTQPRDEKPLATHRVCVATYAPAGPLAPPYRRTCTWAARTPQHHPSSAHPPGGCLGCSTGGEGQQLPSQYIVTPGQLASRPVEPGRNRFTHRGVNAACGCRPLQPRKPPGDSFVDIARVS